MAKRIKRNLDIILSDDEYKIYQYMDVYDWPLTAIFRLGLLRFRIYILLEQLREKITGGVSCQAHLSKLSEEGEIFSVTKDGMKRKISTPGLAKVNHTIGAKFNRSTNSHLRHFYIFAHKDGMYQCRFAVGKRKEFQLQADASEFSVGVMSRLIFSNIVEE